MLTVVYVHHRLKSSELCCYVNGKAVMNAEVNLPNTDDVRVVVVHECFREREERQVAVFRTEGG